MKTKIILFFAIIIFGLLFIGLTSPNLWGQTYIKTLEYIPGINLHPSIKGNVKITYFALDEEKNQIVVLKESERLSAITYGFNSPMIIRNVWKEIYGVVDGKIKLIKRIDGKIIPAVTTPERVEWENK